VKAKYTVVATGPWLDETIAPLRGGKPLLRLTKGVHLVTPRATKHAHVLFADDDRLFFVIPWGDLQIVGTTDTDFEGDPATAGATPDDVRYLTDAACRAFPAAPLDRILFTYAGVRALVREEGVSESKVSRKHDLYDHQKRDRVAGVISVVGGKITAYRDIAEEATDLVAERLKARGRSATARHALPGARDDGVAAPATVSAATWAHLGSIYGSRAGRVLALADGDAALRPLCPHHAGIAAEVDHAVESEWARTVGDVLLRRTMLGLASCQGVDAAETVAARMGARLGWDSARRAEEVAHYRAEIEPMRRLATA
jgi:glycerol-3-phosphate dehydrogenase